MDTISSLVEISMQSMHVRFCGSTSVARRRVLACLAETLVHTATDKSLSAVMIESAASNEGFLQAIKQILARTIVSTDHFRLCRDLDTAQ